MKGKRERENKTENKRKNNKVKKGGSQNNFVEINFLQIFEMNITLW